MRRVGVLLATDGRGQIKRLVVIVGVGLLVSFPSFAQNNESDSASADESIRPVEADGLSDGRVDERTLLFADQAGAGESQDLNVSGFSYWDLVRMVLVLGVVVGLIYLVFYLLRRAGNGKYVQNDLIKVVGSQPLPGNRAIYLVQVGTQVFMVGAGSESVTLLGEITDKETVDAVVLAAGESPGERRSFAEAFSSLIQGGQEPSLDLMRRQRERLERLRS